MRYLTILSAILFSITVRAACPDCDTSAGYAEVTTLDASVSEAPGFFVVYLSDLPADWHTAMSDASDTDGKTIRVSLAGNQVPCYPLGVNTGTDTGALFIYGSGVSPSADTAFGVYVGDGSLSMPAVTDTYGRNAVFADYSSVYILNSLTDLTGSGINLTANGSITGGYSSGYEGVQAYDFDGTDDYLNAASPTVTDWPLTIEALANADIDTAAIAVAALGNTGNLNNFALLRYGGATGGDPINFALRGNSGTESSANSSTGFTVSTWQYSAGDRDADTGTTHAYMSGSSVGTQSTTLTASTGFNRVAIGTLQRSTTVNFFNGKIAYVGISNSVRSANYLATMNTVWGAGIYSVGSWVETSSMTVKEKTRGFFSLSR